jgi:hypothetical protein
MSLPKDRGSLFESDNLSAPARAACFKSSTKIRGAGVYCGKDGRLREQLAAPARAGSSSKQIDCVSLGGGADMEVPKGWRSSLS